MPHPFRIAFSAALLLGAAMPAPAQSPVEVATFGALPDDNSDDTQALKDAFATLTSNQKLVFEPGQYDLFLQDPPGQFLLNGLTNIELAGCHATLMLHGFNPEDPAPWKINQLFGFSNCQGATVSNLTIEMARAPFSCGTVEAVTGNQGTPLVASVRFTDEFPVTPDIYIASMFRYHSDGRPWGQDCDYYFGDVETPFRSQPTIAQNPAEPDVLQITLPQGVILAVGDKITLRHRNYGCNAFTAWDCSPAPSTTNAVTLFNVTIHTIPGMGFYASGTHGVQIRTLRVIPTPGTYRLMSTTSDATHFQLCTGTITFDPPTYSTPQTVLEGMGDDGVNVHGPFSEIEQLVATSGGNLVRIGPAGAFHHREVYKVGDEVGIYDKRTLGLLRLSTVTSAAMVSGQLELGLSQPPSSAMLNELIANLTRRPAVRINGVRVGHNRGRGFVIQTADVDIRNCTIERCTGSGIHIRCDATDFFESTGVEDVVIADNLLNEVNNGYIVGNPRYTRAAISIAAEVGTGVAVGVAGCHSQVSIQGNTIQNTLRPAVHVGSAHTTSLTGNVFDQVCIAASPSGPLRMQYAIWIENSIATTVTGNTLNPTPSGTLGWNQVNSSGTDVNSNFGF